MKKKPKRFHYDNGLPFSNTLDVNLAAITDRVLKRNKAGMIIIDGGVGEGKTTLAVHSSDFIQGGYVVNGDGYKKKESKFIEFQNQLAMGGLDFTKKLKFCYNNGLVVAVYDEAGDFNRRGALSRFNALLNRVFETFRAFKIIVILCLPSFHVLDSDLLDKKIPRLLLHCYDRSDNYGRYKGYSLYRMFYLAEKMKKLVVKPHAYDIVDPNFHGQFLDLEKVRAKSLDHYSTTGKLDILETADIKYEGLLSFEQIAKNLQRSIVWVRDKCKKLKLKHKRIYKKKMYFEPYVTDVLLHELDKEGEYKDGMEEKENRDKIKQSNREAKRGTGKKS